MINSEIKGGVAHLLFNDGDLNILSQVAIDKLQQALEFAESNPDVKTLVLEGNGRSFCAGLDLTVLRQGGEPAEQLLRSTGKLLLGLYLSRLRVVSLCAGHAVAAGALLLLVSDYRVGVSHSGIIGFTEVENGIPVSEFTVRLAEARLNPRDLYAALALSRTYNSDQACVAGFLDVVMPSYREARYHGLTEAERLGEFDDQAYLTSSQRVRAPMQAYFKDLLEGAS